MSADPTGYSYGPGKFVIDELLDEITAAGLLLPAYVNGSGPGTTVNSDVTNIDIFYTNPLSPSDKSLLDSVVSVHSSRPRLAQPAIQSRTITVDATVGVASVVLANDLTVVTGNWLAIWNGNNAAAGQASLSRGESVILTGSPDKLALSLSSSGTLSIQRLNGARTYQVSLSLLGR